MIYVWRHGDTPHWDRDLMGEPWELAFLFGAIALFTCQVSTIFVQNFVDDGAFWLFTASGFALAALVMWDVLSPVCLLSPNGLGDDYHARDREKIISLKSVIVVSDRLAARKLVMASTLLCFMIVALWVRTRYEIGLPMRNILMFGASIFLWLTYVMFREADEALNDAVEARRDLNDYYRKRDGSLLVLSNDDNPKKKE